MGLLAPSNTLKLLRGAAQRFASPQPKPAAPKVPESPLRQPDGKTALTSSVFGPSAPKAPTPQNFNYSQYSAPTSPSTVNTATTKGGVQPPTQAPAPPKPTGFTSTDPNTLKRIAEMQTQTIDRSSQAPAPAPITQAPPQISPAQAGAASSMSPEILRSAAERALGQSREQYLGALSPSEKERQLADELAQFQGDARMGIAGLEGQGRGIPLDLVRGLQEKLTEQAAIQEQTLLGRLSAEQAARQTEALRAQTALGFAEADLTREEAKRAAEAAGLKPIEVGGSLVALNPETGQYETVYQAPAEAGDEGFTLSEGQSRFDSQGNLIAGGQTDPLKRQKAMLEIAKLENELSGGNIDPYEQETKMLELQQLRDEVSGKDPASQAKEQEQIQAKQATVNVLQDKIDLIDELLESDGLDGAVGWASPGRVAAPWNISAKQNFLAGMNQLIGKAAMQELADLKARGGTLGALSDKELELLTTAGTKFGTWQQEDGTFKIDVDSFKEELKNIKAMAERATREAVFTPSSSSFSPGDMEYLQQNLTPEEFQYLQSQSGGAGFTNDLGRSENGLGKLSERYESGGNPGAIGYDSTGGLSYGTFQLAHQNAKRFVEQSTYANEFQGIPFNSQKFQQKWKELAQRDPQGFEKAQHLYIAKTHFQPQVAKLAKAGIDVRRMSRNLQDVIWSTAVQHGANTPIVANAIKKVGMGASEAELIQAIYNERWSGGRQFSSSTPQVRRSVYNRFFGPQGEMQMALAKANQSRNIG